MLMWFCCSELYRPEAAAVLQSKLLRVQERFRCIPGEVNLTSQGRRGEEAGQHTFFQAVLISVNHYVRQ